MSAGRYLLVDAYNVIYATDSLRRLLQEGQDAACDRLAEIVRAIHDAEAVRVAMVLDSRNDKLEVEHPFGKKSFEYLYAPSDLTADGVIERIVRRAHDPGKVTVASNDNLVREATRSAGAIALRPQELMEWARGCEKRLEQDAIRRNAENAKAFRNGLDINF
ncbi:hypothetical protein DDZ13_05660 [Coraliomargarita sinensis]|uniref:RNA-binding protein n=1 Tax=Coraliomargarita sinensis TaxID=2174842 RepID=A0A317ZL32_9BACT|nr:NYN domain-containing protein [Coraliomargarita sinensis]PXA04658.1 hypothetical protein DDZ13_05660 [Coraliomargarita sinensis]